MGLWEERMRRVGMGLCVELGGAGRAEWEALEERGLG